MSQNLVSATAELVTPLMITLRAAAEAGISPVALVRVSVPFKVCVKVQAPGVGMKLDPAVSNVTPPPVVDMLAGTVVPAAVSEYTSLMHLIVPGAPVVTPEPIKL